MSGKTVERVPMDSRRRMRRAWMADSWTVGMEKADEAGGLEKRCWGEEILKAVVVETTERRVVNLRYILAECLEYVLIKEGGS